MVGTISVRVAARIAQRQAGVAAAPLSPAVGWQHRRRSGRPPVAGHRGVCGRRGGRRGTRVRVVFAVAAGGRGGRGLGRGRGRPAGRRRAVARVGAQRCGGQVVQEVKVGDGLSLLVAEPDEEVAAAYDRLSESRCRAPEHAETVADGGR